MPVPIPSSLDAAFGVHARALAFRSARSQVLASNLGNADTPNYKARDLDFREALRSAAPSAVGVAKTHERHMDPSEKAHPGQKYRNPYQPTLDGNTVEAEVEQAHFSKNAVQYQISLMFLGGKIQSRAKRSPSALRRVECKP